MTRRLGDAVRVRLDDEQRAELEQLAELDRRSLSYLARVALDEYLERRRHDLRPRASRASAAPKGA